MRLLPLALLSACCATLATGADAPVETKSNARDTLKARLAEETKAAPTTTKAPTPPAATAKSEPAAKASPPPAGTEAAKPAADDPANLPDFNIRRNPVEVVEQYDRIYEQEKKILAEKRKTRATETDRALNDSRVSKALSIFGGESSDYRANIAKERVSLMEDEKDIMEAMVLAKSPEEKKELQKQLEELRAIRRDLEKSLR